jgi:CubicO group peptidase (beta-lactamase class C family)
MLLAACCLLLAACACSLGVLAAAARERYDLSPIPDSRFPIPDSRFPIPDSRLPTMRPRVLWFLLALPCTARAQYVIGARDTLASRVDAVFRTFDRVDSPGCSVGVYRDGKILYARGYGMANLELGAPNTPRTVFDIGSVSKEFTATAILLLAQDGKLSLEDDIRRYFPEMPAYASGVTIRNMLNHTSGIRDYLTLMNVAGRSSDGVADTVDFLRFITRSAETNFPIGTRYLYSNSGFALLGQLVYRLSGQPLPQFLQQRVLGPLAMHDSRSLGDHTAIIPNRAQGYAPRGGGFAIASSQYDGTGGAGSMHVTVEDFARWDHNWDEPTVGGRALVDALQVRGKLKNDSTISYALGVSVDTWRGLRTVSHGGSWAGYRAHFVRFPEQHLSVTTFCNLTTSGPDTLALKVASVYLGAKMSADTIGAWDTALTSAPAVPMTAEQLRGYEGAWRNTTLGEVRRTRLRGDTLMLGAGNLAQLVPLGAGRFRVGRTNTELTFDGSSGTPTRLRVRTRTGTILYSRVPVQPLTTQQLAEYVGEYRSDEIETTNSFAADSGRLVVTRAGRRAGMFEPVSRDLFVGPGGVVEFARDARGRVVSFTLQAGRVRNLRFIRVGAQT